MLKGVAASPGIGIGEAVLLREEAIEVTRREVQSAEDEKRRFLSAAEKFIAEMEQASDLVYQNVGPKEADILGAQIAIIRDPELTKEVLRTIEHQKICAEYAFHLICNGYIALFANLEDEHIAARAADFQDIRDRMLRILLGVRKIDFTSVKEGSVLIAEDIAPSQAAGLEAGRIRGIITERGTKFSHIAIIARALKIPAVVAVEGIQEILRDGDPLILDGNSGVIRVRPCERELTAYGRLARAERRHQISLESYRNQPTRTMDGRKIGLYSNLALEKELDAIRENNADGIGMFRSEFVYMERSAAPSEQEQYEVYSRLIQAMQGKPVVIRTLDVGGDKDIPYLSAIREENPFLGHRALRYCLNHPECFKKQLTALLRASAHGDMRIILPMVSCISELRETKTLLAEAEQDLERRGEPFRKDIPLGIMIETPAAVICADDLARECSFFSIGTNDLTQYVLAVDRGNGCMASLYNTMHPAVLRMIALAAQAARGAHIPVSVCGEAASDPLLVPFLIGLGINQLSVNSSSLLTVRALVDSLSYSEWEKRVPSVLALTTAEEVRHYLAGKCRKTV